MAKENRPEMYPIEYMALIANKVNFKSEKLLDVSYSSFKHMHYGIIECEMKLIGMRIWK